MWLGQNWILDFQSGSLVFFLDKWKPKEEGMTRNTIFQFWRNSSAPGHFPPWGE